MRYNLDLPLQTLDGKPFEPPQSLKSACFTALMMQQPTDHQIPPERKIQMFDLGLRVHRGGIQALTAEEVTTLKSRANTAYGVYMFGTIVRLLEGDAAVPDPPAAADPSPTEGVTDP